MGTSSWLRRAKPIRWVVSGALVMQLALFAGCGSDSVAPRVIREIVIEDRVLGSGPQAEAGDTVLFHYVGFISATGQVFDNSYELGVPLEVIAGEKGTEKQSAIIKNNKESGSVVAGLARGLVGLRLGGRRIISVPQELAYGGCNNAPAGIPELVCNSDYLEFEVTVLAIRF